MASLSFSSTSSNLSSDINNNYSIVTTPSTKRRQFIDNDKSNNNIVNTNSRLSGSHDSSFSLSKSVSR
jgi:hypothetical protein